jgi:hypothetical protein
MDAKAGQTGDQENSMQEVEYEKYVDMIRAEVWKTAKTNPHVDYDELLSAGNLAFAEVIKTWKPERGAFSTHLWYRLRYRIGRTAKDAKRNQTNYLADEKMKQIEEGSGYFAAKMSELSQEAKFVVNLVFTSGVELVDMTTKRVRTSKNSIRQYLQSEGWAIPTISKVFDELKEVVS